MADLPRFDLGQAGVVLTSSPVHGDPSQLTTGQNIEFLRASGLGGVGSRGPLQPFTLSIMKKADGTTPGAVLAAVEVPLPSPVDAFGAPLLVFTTTGFDYSLDGGTTWTSVALPAAPGTPFPVAPVAVAGVVYSTTKDGKLQTKDGVVDATGGQITALLALNNRLYYCVADHGYYAGTWDGVMADPPDVAITGRVREYDPASHTARTICEEFGAGGVGVYGATNPQDITNAALVSALGMAPAVLSTDGTNLYVRTGFEMTRPQGQGNNALGFLNSYELVCEPIGDIAWTVNFNVGLNTGFFQGPHIDNSTFNPLHYIQRPYVWARDLFLSCDLNLFGDARHFAPSFNASCVAVTIQPVGAFNTATFDDSTVSNEFPNPGSEWFLGPIVFANRMFFAYGSADRPPDDVPTAISMGLIMAVDVGSISVSTAVPELDVIGTYGGNVLPGTPFLSEDGLSLYWPFYGIVGHEGDGYLLKRTITGTWSQARTGVHLAGGGVSGVVGI